MVFFFVVVVVVSVSSSTTLLKKHDDDDVVVILFFMFDDSIDGFRRKARTRKHECALREELILKYSIISLAMNTSEQTEKPRFMPEHSEVEEKSKDLVERCDLSTRRVKKRASSAMVYRKDC